MGKIVFSETARRTKVAGRWSFALLNRFPEKGVGSLTISASLFSRAAKTAAGATNVFARSMDDVAFDSGTDYSIVLSGLPPGCRAGLRDGETGAELSDAASGVAGENGEAVLTLAAPLPVLGTRLRLAMPPDSPAFKSVTIGISRDGAGCGSQLREVRQ